MEQLSKVEPQIFQPGNCPHELQVADMSGKGNLKSECDLTSIELGHSMWTNCRMVGRCTLGDDA